MAIWNNTSNPAIASGNLLDINAAINGGTDSLSQVWGANTVKDGDTVVIPNGTWDWNNAASGLTNGLTYTKGIILKGGTTVAGNHTTVSAASTVTTAGVFSNGMTIGVTNGTNFKSSGYVIVQDNAGKPHVVNYTGKSGNNLTNCTSADSFTLSTLQAQNCISQSGMVATDSTIIVDNIGTAGTRAGSFRKDYIIRQLTTKRFVLLV